MNKKLRIEYLKAAVFSENWSKAYNACNQLFNFGGRFNKTGRKKCRRFLVELLCESNPQTRNVAALIFRHNGYNAAVIPLFQAITNPKNAKNRGTLVYALEKLNCSKHLAQLFRILFATTGNWEVQAHVLSILENQAFSFTKEDLQSLEKDWNAIRNEWNMLHNIDENNVSQNDFDRKLIQSFVDSYITCL